MHRHGIKEGAGEGADLNVPGDLAQIVERERDNPGVSEGIVDKVAGDDIAAPFERMLEA